METNDQAIEVSDKGKGITISTGANINELVRRAELIDQVYRRIMQKDMHYGIIPGTGSSKPTLLKAGAEKLCAIFNLGSPDPQIQKIDLPDGHREYIVIVNIKHYPSGKLIGSGVGSCSTMESKYRYRNVADYTVTGEVIPRDYKEKKQEYRKQGLGAKQVEGVWEWVKYGDSAKTENPDIADVYNTVLKMAKKRALIDAVLTATGASDIFTQDIEDFSDLRETPVESAKPAPADGDLKAAAAAAKKPATKKMEVTEGIEGWDVEVDDIQQDPKGNYYTIGFKDGRSCFTADHEMAKQMAEAEGIIRIEVRPGRTPKSKVLHKTYLSLAEEPVES